MKALASLSCLILAGSFSVSASAQVSVVSTRTFTNEVIDLRNPTTLDFTGFIFVGGLGIGSSTSLQGSPQLVEFDLDVQMDIDLDILNVFQADATFYYSPYIQIQPNGGDCSQYAGVSVSETSSTVAPGGMASLQVNRTDRYAWSGASFSPSCGTNQWYWSDLIWNTDPGNNNVLTSSAGFQVFDSWVQTNHATATINGEFSATWNPDPLPFQTVCAGTAAPTVELEPYGGFGATASNVYLFQDGAPASTNLLIAADQGTPTIQPSGLCVAGTIRRVPGSLSQGGQPFRLPDADALIGTTTYFQSWFRSGAGTSATSECIELTFP